MVVCLYSKASQYLSLRQVPAWGLVLLLALFIGCKPGPTPTLTDPTAPKEAGQSMLNIEYHQHLPHVSYQFEASQLKMFETGVHQRAVWDNPALQILEADGTEWMQIRAKTAIALYPFAEISLYDFTLTADGTDFEGDHLVWPYQDSLEKAAFLGPILMINPSLMVEGDTVIVDILMQGYTFLHVRSVMDLDGISAEESNSEQVD
jgi:hypothetical protein